MKKLTRFKLALLAYVLFDFLIGGHCGGFFSLDSVAAAQSGPPAIGNITSAGSTCSTTSVPTNCVILQLDAASGAATIDISGTWAATLQFEGFTGVTWTNINCTPPNSTTAASSSTANGAWQCNVAAYSAIRVRGSAYTSGTAVVYINSAHASAKSGGGAVFASGGTTNNVIPKSNGSSLLADSALTDNGTTITSTELIIPNATSSATVIGGIGTASNGSGFNFAATQIQFMQSAQRLGAFAAGDFTLAANSKLAWSNTATDALGTATDTFIDKRSAANIRFGAGDLNGTPVDQTISVQNAITGSDLPGGHFTIDAPLGTGLGAGSKTCLNRALMKATGATAQIATNGFCVGESKTLSNTSATAQVLANISVPSNSAGGVEGTINVNCTDGTNFDSETQSFNTSFVNKAGTVTVTNPVITATSAANNSGSCTAGITAVANGNGVDIKVTPVFGTIVPTTTTGTVMKLTVMAGGNVTIN